MIFTVKQKKQDKIYTQPPDKLQFHDASVTSQGISYPLQFHENLEDVTKDMSDIVQPVVEDDVIDHKSTQMVIEDLENYM